MDETRQISPYRDPSRRDDCEYCQKYGGSFAPSHDGSPRCLSGSLASGGSHAHCTCDTCF